MAWLARRGAWGLRLWPLSVPPWGDPCGSRLACPVRAGVKRLSRFPRGALAAKDRGRTKSACCEVRGAKRFCPTSPIPVMFSSFPSRRLSLDSLARPVVRPARRSGVFAGGGRGWGRVAKLANLFSFGAGWMNPGGGHAGAVVAALDRVKRVKPGRGRRGNSPVLRLCMASVPRWHESACAAAGGPRAGGVNRDCA